MIIELQTNHMGYDAFLSSWIDSNVSLKSKQQKSQKLGHAPWLTTLLGLEGRARAPGWD